MYDTQCTVYDTQCTVYDTQFLQCLTLLKILIISTSNVHKFVIVYMSPELLNYRKPVADSFFTKCCIKIFRFGSDITHNDQ